MDVGPNQSKFITFWVSLRTSFWYLYAFVGFCFTWVFLTKSSILPLDNPDLTYLNLGLSILAEVSAIVILVYTLRITERNEKADARERADIERINAKLDKLLNTTKEISEDIDELVEEENAE